MSKVLILYGTRYGTTREISDEIEKFVKGKGISTESYNLEDVKLKNVPPLTEYDGVIIGTGIKMKMWTSTVKSLVQKRKFELKEMEKSLGFYVCCGEAAKKENIGGAIEKYILPRLEKVGVKAELIDAFGGAYDLREGSAITGMTRKIVIGIMRDEEGIENPEGELHDFRDWEQIEEFANQFVKILEKK
ncbi:MAG: flavodoxin domain-containing protein [Candidatus Hermodarchaeota archaeon]